MKRILISFILAAVFLSAAISANAKEETDSLGGLLKHDYKKYILSNGLTTIIKEAPSTGLVSIDVRVRAGSASEAKYSGSGISHLVEHMIFKGTPTRKPAEIEKLIRSHGGTINAATTFDYTSFIITIPS